MAPTYGWSSCAEVVVHSIIMSKATMQRHKHFVFSANFINPNWHPCTPYVCYTQMWTHCIMGTWLPMCTHLIMCLYLTMGTHCTMSVYIYLAMWIYAAPLVCVAQWVYAALWECITQCVILHHRNALNNVYTLHHGYIYTSPRMYTAPWTSGLRSRYISEASRRNMGRLPTLNAVLPRKGLPP